MGALSHPLAPPGVEQHDIPWRDFQQATRFAVLLGIAAAMFYLTFVFDRSHENYPVLWIGTVVAETIVVLHTLGIWMTLARYRSSTPEPEGLAVVRRGLITGERPTPTIDVFICTYGESLMTLARTTVAAQEMVLPHNTWILDDARRPEVRQLATELGVGYLRRTDNAHAKAGNVNAAIARTSGQFVVVLDADHVPRPDFLVQTIPYLATNPSIAMVQTPQTYATADRGPIAEGAAVSQELFYEAIMPAKNEANAAFCVGTNVVYRRSALESLTDREATLAERVRARFRDQEAASQPTMVGQQYPAGGIWVGSNSEDIWTSLELHRRGWRTVFVPKVLTQGLTPDRLGAFLKQQFRWASGGWEVLLRGKVIGSHRLTLSQKLHYMLVPSHYALSLSMTIFAFMSPIYLLTDRSPINAPFWDWAVHYIPFYTLTLAVPFLQAGRIRLSAIVVSMAAVPVHLKALMTTALRQHVSWSATNGRHGQFSLRAVLPHLFVGILCMISLLVGWSLRSHNPTSTAQASFFVVAELAMITAVVIQAEQSDRAASRNEALEATDDEALELARDYATARTRRRGLTHVGA